MALSVLGSVALDFLTRGEQKTQGTLGKFQGLLGSVQKAASGLTGLIKGGLIGAVQAAGVPVQNLSGALASIASIAVRNSVEGKRLADLWTLFARVAGDVFAPAVRLATDAILVMIDLVKDLTPLFFEMGKAALDSIEGLAGQFGSLRSIAEVVFQGIADLWLVVVEAFRAGVKAIILAADTLLRGMQTLGKIFENFGEGAGVTIENLRDVWEAFIAAMLASIKVLVRRLELLAQTYRDVFHAISSPGAFSTLGANVFGPHGTLRQMFDPQIIAKEFSRGFEDAMKTVKANRGAGKAFAGLFADLGGQVFDRIKNAFSKGKLKLRAEVAFESLQGTFERIQKQLANDPLANTEKEQLQATKNIADTIRAIFNQGLKISNLPSAVGP